LSTGKVENDFAKPAWRNSMKFPVGSTNIVKHGKDALTVWMSI
jgi:hypothetical protein